MSLQIIILAAGAGTRMQSSVPKVLQTLAGKSLLEYVYTTARALLPDNEKPLIVYGHGGEQLQKMGCGWSVEWVQQLQQLGTGHAVQQALPFLEPNRQVLILCGDVPLLDVEEVRRFLAAVPPHSIGIMSAHVLTSTGYGRILRDAGQHVLGIVEEKEATLAQRSITEINTGIFSVPVDLLKRYLERLNNHNQQKEYYLTDIIALAHAEHQPIVAIAAKDSATCLGINTRSDLARMERFLQARHAQFWMEKGVHLADPNRFDIRGDVTIGADTFIDINVLLSGKVRIGKGCRIDPNVILHNAVLQDHVHIRANTMVEDAVIGAESIIGPFARIRPHTQLGKRVHIGNFVELKHSQVGAGTKINHLSYIGDSVIGERVNVGAGTITCNYDGVNKHQTVIEDDVFIGSDTQLIAPVTIKHHASIAAGSTITKDVDSNQLTLTHTLHQRTRQKKTLSSDKSS